MLLASEDHQIGETSPENPPHRRPAHMGEKRGLQRFLPLPAASQACWLVTRAHGLQSMRGSRPHKFRACAHLTACVQVSAGEGAGDADATEGRGLEVRQNARTARGQVSGRQWHRHRRSIGNRAEPWHDLTSPQVTLSPVAIPPGSPPETSGQEHPVKKTGLPDPSHCTSTQ